SHLRFVPALWPDHPVGHGELGELRADDGSPFAQERGGGEAARARRSVERSRRIGADRPRRACRPSQGSALFVVHGVSRNGGAIARSACFLSAELTPWPKPRRGLSWLYAEARDNAGPAGRREHRRRRARLVRPRAPPPAVAGRTRRGARSLPRM